MIGLLTVSDYINASTDANCKSTLSKSCQNYNYLKISNDIWWLATADSANTSDVYYVTDEGYILSSSASISLTIRPTIMLNNNVMIKGGKGTNSNPFVLK